MPGLPGPGSPALVWRAPWQDATLGGMSRYPYVVYAWDGHSPYRLVMFPNESYRQVHTRDELEVLAKEWGLDLDDPDQVVWEGGDRWPPPPSPR